MSDTNQTQGQPSPIDEEAAQIDARSEDAPEQIEELIEHAHEGDDRSRPQREDPLAPGNFVDDRSAGEVPEPNEPG